MTHALPDPTGPIWPTDTFLKVGSVVPVSVMRFNEDGTTRGLLADPTVIPPEIAAWARAELAHIRSWVPGPDVVSPHCGHPFFTTLSTGEKLRFFCTEVDLGHAIDHEARGKGPELLAYVPVRKPTPRKRAA